MLVFDSLARPSHVSGQAHLPYAVVFETTGEFHYRAKPGEGRVGTRIGRGKRHFGHY